MQPSTTTLLLAVLTAFTTALPTTSSALVERAGGPAIKPIPDTCTITNPLPASRSGESYLPSAPDAALYSSYYPAFSSNKTAMAEQCLQQCYGYGDSTQCKTAFWAQNVVVPEGYYGSPGGDLETACLMFNRPLTSSDFAAAPAGQATDAYAGNIAC